MRDRVPERKLRHSHFKRPASFCRRSACCVKNVSDRAAYPVFDPFAPVALVLKLWIIARHPMLAQQSRGWGIGIV